MTHHRDETCASHMSIQMEFFRLFRPSRVLELGCGYYSTKFYLDSGAKLVSVESDSDAWYTMMVEHFGVRSRWSYVRLSGLDTVREFMLREHFDLVFVDGDVHRAEETNSGFQIAETVIVHDSQGWQHDQAGVFLRDRFRVPESFWQVDFMMFPIGYGALAGCSDRPWTTLFTRNVAVRDHFSCVDEDSLYARYRFPYVYDACPNPECSCVVK